MGSRNKSIDILKNKKILILGGAAVLALVIAVFAFAFLGKKQQTPIADQSFKNLSKDSGIYSGLTGEEVKPEVLERRPLAIMIENYWEARPQSGLDKADIIYEALAEGGITRFMAIYQQNDAPEIGPVRSARPYYLLRALEYDPIYGHVGGTPQALSDIKKLQLIEIDEMSAGTKVYWRSADRKAPHNTYTSTEKMRAYAKEKGYDKKVNISAFKFLKAGEENKGGNDANKVTIHYPTKENTIIYNYNTTNKNYERSHLTGIHLDKSSGKQLTAKNIIIQFTPSKVDTDGLHMEIAMVGQGKAMLVTQGKVYTGKWSKKSERERTIFTDDRGNDFKLNPGQTWVEIVTTDTKIDI